MPLDPAQLPQLGRLPYRHDDRTLLADVYMRAVSPPPPSVNWQSRVSSGWPMYGNDRHGDCTEAARWHMVGLWTFDDSGAATVVPDARVLADYSGVSGFDPASGANDNGAVMLDVLNQWRKSDANPALAFVKLNPANHDQIKQAVNVFGAVYVGAAMPTSAQRETGPGLTWTDVTDAPGSWGGHCFPVGAYDASAALCVTWGAEQRLTWAWWDRYVEEAWVVLSNDWLGGDGHDPQGFDLPTLQADLAAIGANKPTPAPPAPPSPNPPPPDPAVLKVVLSDQRVIGRVKLAAVRAGLSFDEYVQHRLGVYFRIADAAGVPGETEAELDAPTDDELAELLAASAPPF